MAEVEQPNNNLFNSPGVFYTQDYSLDKLNFLLASGQKFDLKKLLIELSYYEDLYSFAVSGYLTVQDGQGFIEILQLTGNQFLEIEFGKIKGAPNNIKQTLRVYKIENRKPSGNMNTESYKLYFCSEELILSEQIKISKSVVGNKISDVIKGVLTDFNGGLFVNSKKIYSIEETMGIYDFIVPRLKPFEAISWLSNYARPAASNSTDQIADMLFFQNKDGFNFRSLQSMFKEPVYNTYKYQLKNLAYETQSFQEKMSTILNYEFVKTYDMLNDINQGTFANKLISLDPITRTANTTVYNYSLNKTKKLNPKPITNELENRLKLTQSNSPDASFKVATGNSMQQNSPYIKQIPNAIAQNIAIETYVPNRTAQISLANYTVMKMTIPGDPGISVGRTINVNLFTLKPTTTFKGLDEFYSGKYLVTAVRHIIQPNVYQTVVEVAKDSSVKSYSGINNFSNEWQKAVKL
jgi:hypothetical protein